MQEQFNIAEEVVFFDESVGCEGGVISYLTDSFAIIDINEFLQITIPFEFLSHNEEL